MHVSKHVEWTVYTQASRDELYVYYMCCVSTVALTLANRSKLPSNVGLLKVKAVCAGIEIELERTGSEWRMHSDLLHMRLSRYLGILAHRKLCAIGAP